MRNSPALPSSWKTLRLLELAGEDSAQAPINTRIFRRFRDLISDGVLPPGSKLPPSRILARSLGVSRNSVVAAYEKLLADGWVETRQGSAVRVAAEPPHQSIASLADGAPAEIPLQGPKPFAVGVSALDVFPIEKWTRLQARLWRKMPPSRLSEGASAGAPELRAAIATHVATSRAIRCTPGQVFVTASTRSAINLVARALALRAGDAVWVEDPGYFAPKTTLRTMGLEVVPVGIDSSGFRVEEALRREPDAKLALVTPACQFPMGYALSPERRAALVAWADRSQGWIVEDDYDAGFGIGGRPPAPLLVSHPSDRVVHVSSFNKSMFPALRLAFIIAPPALAGALEALQGDLDGPTNAPNQLVMAEFIGQGFLDDHLIRSRAIYARRRQDFLRDLDTQLASYLIPHPDPSGLHVVCRLHRHGEREFCQLASELGLDVTPMGLLTDDKERSPQVLLGFSGADSIANRNGMARLARRLAETDPGLRAAG